MCQYEKLRRSILHPLAVDSPEYTDYPIPQTADSFGFSAPAFCEILKGMANAGFIDVSFDGRSSARVTLHRPEEKNRRLMMSGSSGC